MIGLELYDTFAVLQVNKINQGKSIEGESSCIGHIQSREIKCRVML